MFTYYCSLHSGLAATSNPDSGSATRPSISWSRAIRPLPCRCCDGPNDWQSPTAFGHLCRGTIYFDQRLLDRSLECYQKAYEWDVNCGDTLGQIYDLRDIGNVYRAIKGKEDSCIVCFEKARSLSIASHALEMQRDVESQMAAYYLYRNQLEEAARLLKPAFEHVDKHNRNALFFMMADYYNRANQRDSATNYYRALLDFGNIYSRMGAHRVLAGYSMQDGKIDEALHHLAQFEMLTDSVLEQNDGEALRKMTALYDYSLREEQNTKLRYRLFEALAAVAVLIVVVVVMTFFHIRKRMHDRLKLQKLELLLTKYHGQNDGQAASRLSAMSQFPVFQRIERQLADSQVKALGDSDWHELEEGVERVFPGFFNRLQEFCRLTPQQRRVTLLLKVGIPPVGIAQLTAHSKQSVSNTRSRLYEKAFGRKGTPAQWDEFVQSL